MNVKKLLTQKEGQSMVEYGYIIALIAIGCMAAVQLFGKNLLQLYNNLSV